MKLAFTLELERELAERLSARAIREGKNLEAVIVELLRGRLGATTTRNERE